jgi:acyl-CoA synthetase (AMP-forming)/AMP-acid ligase II
MNRSAELNFAGQLVRRLGPNSCLIDAATGETVPARSFPALVAGFAYGFLSSGLEPGDRILIGWRLSPASTLAYLGAMYAGLVPVPLEERVLSLSGEPVYKTTEAKGIWTGKGIKCEWVERLGVRHFTGMFDAHSIELIPPHPIAASDLAALMPTSGSTGTPRLVMTSHGNLAANTEAIIRSQHLEPDERAMLILPVSYCFGASVLHTHLYQGGGVVFDSRFMFPDKVLRAIDSHGCTTFAGVPTVYNILLGRSNLRSIPLPSLRRFLQAGGALAPKSVQQMREVVPTAQFYVMYGQTEATARVSCLPPQQLGEKLGSAGVPLENLLVRIADDEGQEVSVGQTGEIWVKGPSICSGYFNDPKETSRKLQDGWLKTGDMASVDADGYLWITGRKGEFMKIRGVRVSFAEVETLVAQVSGVCECAVTSTAHPEAGEAIAIFVVPHSGASDVTARVRGALPPHWTCSKVNLVEELPKTANGKIFRNLLQTML